MSDIKENDWVMETASGRMINISDPLGDINLHDIAHALSMQCRFNGHCRVFYSIAQHSVLSLRRFNDDTSIVNSGNYDRRSVVENIAKQVLLHDAAEAYIGDIIRPIKHTALYEVRAIENTLNKAIFGRYNTHETEESKRIVKLIDSRMLATEKRDIMGDGDWGTELPEPYPNKITSWKPKVARELFLLMAERLGMK